MVNLRYAIYGRFWQSNRDTISYTSSLYLQPGRNGNEQVWYDILLSREDIHQVPSRFKCKEPDTWEKWFEGKLKKKYVFSELRWLLSMIIFRAGFIIFLTIVIYFIVIIINITMLQIVCCIKRTRQIAYRYMTQRTHHVQKLKWVFGYQKFLKYRHTTINSSVVARAHQ